jgi:T4 superinfection immunity protein
MPQFEENSKSLRPVSPSCVVAERRRPLVAQFVVWVLRRLRTRRLRFPPAAVLDFRKGWQMNNLLRVILIGGLVACAIVVAALGLVRHDADLMAPVNLVLFVVGILVYFLPTGLAMYRDCKATAWIAVVNVLLGWTILGWFVALGWSAGGQIRESVHPIATPPTHPIPGH